MVTTLASHVAIHLTVCRSLARSPCFLLSRFFLSYAPQADILAKERLERAKSVAIVVQMQEEERERQLQEVDKVEKHTMLARQATIEEAKEALEEEQRRRMDELHPHEKPVQKMVRQHTKSKVNAAMELERERRIQEKSASGVTPPKINLGNVPVIN